MNNNQRSRPVFYTLILWIGATVSGLFLLNSCEPDTACKLSRNVELHISFKTWSDGTLQDTSISDLSIFGISREDSLLYDKSSVETVSLPLNPSSDSVSFVFTQNEQHDTLLLTYNREIYMLSIECGFITRYKIISASVRGQMADSLSIPESLVSTDDVTNINLYY